MFTRTIIFILPFFIAKTSAFLSYDYHVRISTNDPIVKGGTIRFVANVYDGNTISAGNKFVFLWEDNAIPQHFRETEEKNATDVWEVTYDADKYAVGTYLVNVVVKYCMLVCFEVTSARSYFDITATLNGNMLLEQGNKTISGNFVSNSTTVSHKIQLKDTDKNYIDNATTVLTYWFLDCTYYGITTDLQFEFNYTKPDQEHTIEALIMADFTPLPPTTTVSPSTTTKLTTTTIKPTITTGKPNTTTTALTTAKPNITNASASTFGHTSLKPSAVARRRRTVVNDNEPADLPNVSQLKVPVKGQNISYNSSFPFVCNGSHLVTDSKKSYGYFSKTIQVKAPISKINVTGNNWIQHGDLLSLNVKCLGSSKIEYCVEYKVGAYNVTGNETCFRYISLDACEFPIKRYLSGSKYTILIIIKNEVSKFVQPVAVTFYEVMTQPQLSVIVVPVAFSLVAVVLIVFGIAYYIQNRSRFIIEVADFNFGQQYSDLEYKTFRERLRDSIMNAFMRGPTPSSSEVPVWPPGRKYGSMT